MILETGKSPMKVPGDGMHGKTRLSPCSRDGFLALQALGKRVIVCPGSAVRTPVPQWGFWLADLIACIEAVLSNTIILGLNVQYIYFGGQKCA